MTIYWVVLHNLHTMTHIISLLLQSLVISIISYMGMLRVTTATEQGSIDEKKLVGYVNNAFEIIYREAAKQNTRK